MQSHWLQYSRQALPSGTTEDGRKIGAPGMPPYVMISGTDGYVLGIFV